jgi:NTP pyrophosphatase (non-canonical NTP hydrolase)
MDISDFQRHIAERYGDVDRERGVPAAVAWLTEELGELAQAVRKGTVDDQERELGDVVAWLASLADQLGLSLDAAAARMLDADRPPTPVGGENEPAS